MSTWVAPPPDLRPWTDGGVVVHAPAALAASRFPALVGGMLVVRLAGAVSTPAQQGLPAAALIGPSTRPSSFGHAGAVHAVGLLIRPEAMPALLRGSPACLVDGHLALADLDGPGWGATVAAVHLAADDPTRLALLFDQLRRAVAGPLHGRRHGQLQRLAIAVQGPLGTACRDLALSRRQLERQCLAHFGLAPKQFQTIARLQRTLHAALGAGAAGADLALQAGYYDQSHLARDLRRLAGRPLGQLLQQVQGGGGEHWPLVVGRQRAG